MVPAEMHPPTEVCAFIQVDLRVRRNPYRYIVAISSPMVVDDPLAHCPRYAPQTVIDRAVSWGCGMGPMMTAFHNYQSNPVPAPKARHAAIAPLAQLDTTSLLPGGGLSQADFHLHLHRPVIPACG
jgi:hypothetical protein